MQTMQTSTPAFTSAFRQQLDTAFDTIWAIAKSPAVEEYLIGYTSRSGYARFVEYRKVEYDHLVILIDRLTRKQALLAEQYLQKRAFESRREVTYTRYNQRRRGQRYYPSFGGQPGNPDELIHSVYMAWWGPE